MQRKASHASACRAPAKSAGGPGARWSAPGPAAGDNFE